MRSVTETFEDQNSIEVVKDAKGTFKYTVKVYYHGAEETEAIQRVENTIQELMKRFED